MDIVLESSRVAASYDFKGMTTGRKGEVSFLLRREEIIIPGVLMQKASMYGSV